MLGKHSLKMLVLTTIASVTVMMVGASAAQAKYVILLNGSPVQSIEVGIRFFAGWVKAENGLKIECQEGVGSGYGELVEGASRVVGSASVAFKGCVWVGSEKTCIINDGGTGIINTSGSGEIVAVGEDFILTTSSPEYTTVLTGGVFCTIPEEEVVSGSASVKLTEASKNLTSHTGELSEMKLKLGNSNIEDSEATAEAWHLNNPNATFAIHTVP